MARFAILVGCEEYSDPELYTAAFCHADVDMLADTLIDSCDFEKHNVRRFQYSLRDSVEPDTLLYHLEQLGERTDDGDTLVFFFSGHGVVDRKSGDAFLALPETNLDDLASTALSIRSLDDVLRMEHRRNVRILDTCHSGFDAREKRTEPGFLAKVTDDAHGWVTLASCHPSERSYYDHDRGQGVFTAALCDAIVEDFEPDEDVLPEMLKVRVCERVADYVENNPNKQQTPTLNGSLTGNFEIFRRRPRAKPERLDAPDEQSLRAIDEKVKKLDRLRRFDNLGDAEHRGVLSEYMDQVAAAIDSNSGQIWVCDSFELAIREPRNCNEMPVSFAKLVTGIAENSRFESLHKVAIRREYQERNALERMAMTFAPRKLLAVHHEVEQPDAWPPSYVDVVSFTTGYLPGLRVGFYLLPLHVSARLIGVAGIISDGKRAHRLSSTSSESTALILKPDRDRAIIEEFVASWIKKSNQKYLNAVEARIRSLELEVIDLADAAEESDCDDSSSQEE